MVSPLSGARLRRAALMSLAVVALLVLPSLAVSGQGAGITAAFADDHVESIDNAPVVGTMTIQNNGATSVDVTVSAGYITPGWTAHLATHTLTVPAGGSVDENYTFSPPANASVGSQGQLSVRVSPSGGQLVTAYLYVVTQSSSGGGGDPPDDPPGGTPPPPNLSNNSTDVLAPGHPRLLVRASDLPKLRAWANDSNPIYANGLRAIAQSYKNNMDQGKVPALDNGGITWTMHPTELYAELFAFMSLVEPNASLRIDYADRAHDLLMHVIDQAALGPGDGKYRHERFATYDRMNWWGESFGLTVDWIYHTFTADEKERIRQVFLRWEEEIQTTGRNALVGGSTWSGIPNDPALLQDPLKLRWSMNNYFMVQTRNMAFYALAFDAADDPGGELHSYLGEALTARLFMIDHTLRHELPGGMSPEGWGYGPLGMGRWANLLLALHTAGEDDPAKWGPQVKIQGNPFWPQMLPAFLQSVPPQPRMLVGEEWRGPVYTPAMYGDLSEDWIRDPVDLIAPIGIYASLQNDTATHAAARWIETHVAPGGAGKLTYRVSGPIDDAFNSIQLFLLFDPTLAPAADPRPALALDSYVKGVGQVVSRTSWAPDARMFVMHADPTVIDHQLPEDGSFAFYRGGEWLTKGRSGYDGATSQQCGVGRSDHHNTLAIENDPLPSNNWLSVCAAQGSQMFYVPDMPAEKVRQVEFGASHTYALTNLTSLYNWKGYATSAEDVVAATRAAVFLEPDHVVLYDRALTKTEGRFKRFFMNFAGQPQIVGNVASVSTPGGQQVFATTVLPQAATISASPPAPGEGAAAHELMKWKLRVEGSPAPREARFLHVVQGANAGATPDSAALITPLVGDFDGVVVAGRAILFAADPEQPSDVLQYEAPLGLAGHLVTGLSPNAFYSPQVAVSPAGIVVTLERVDVPASLKATPAGTLAFDANALPVNQPPVTTISLAGQSGEAGWWTGPVLVTLAAADADGPGVASIYVQVDASPSWIYDEAFTLTGDGLRTIAFHATDLAGAQSSPDFAEVRIDATAPTITLANPRAGSLHLGAASYEGLPTTERALVLGPVPLRANATDATSGVARVDFYVDGELVGTATAAPYEIAWKPSRAGEHVIDAWATDLAGNVAKSPPTLVTAAPLPET